MVAGQLGPATRRRRRPTVDVVELPGRASQLLELRRVEQEFRGPGGLLAVRPDAADADDLERRRAPSWNCTVTSSPMANP